MAVFFLWEFLGEAFGAPGGIGCGSGVTGADVSVVTGGWDEAGSVN